MTGAEASGRVLLADVVDRDVTVEETSTAVASDRDGAVVTFAGVVRDHDGGKGVTALDYEGHPTAAAVLREVAETIAAEHPDVRIAVLHRVGALVVGDVALAAAVASPHRRRPSQRARPSSTSSRSGRRSGSTSASSTAATSGSPRSDGSSGHLVGWRPRRAAMRGTMTDTVERAEQRWGAAEARALDVLALPGPRRFSVVRSIALLVLPAVLVLVVGLAFPPGSAGRWTVAWTGSVAYAVVFVSTLMVATRERRRGRVSLPVTDVLLPLEQDAVRRVIRERERAPEDRLDIVRPPRSRGSGRRPSCCRRRSSRSALPACSLPVTSGWSAPGGPWPGSSPGRSRPGRRSWRSGTSITGRVDEAGRTRAQSLYAVAGDRCPIATGARVRGVAGLSAGP